MDVRAKLDPGTLFELARRLENLAQRTYNKRDRHPRADTEGFDRLDGAAMALSHYGSRLLDLAAKTSKSAARRVRAIRAEARRNHY